ACRSLAVRRPASTGSTESWAPQATSAGTVTCRIVEVETPWIPWLNSDAYAAAVRSPQSVAGIVLLDGDALPGGGGAAWLSNLLVPPWYTSLYRIATDWDWLLRRALRGAWGTGSPPFNGAFIEHWERPFRVSGTAAAYASLFSHGIQGVSASTIRQVTVPALVAWGAHDSVDPVDAGRRTARLLHAHFVEIQGAGHLSMLARPRDVTHAIELLSRA
ncbi:MAG TPA: alpha/beta hydrolase, partial [Gaiellaceae bacterium]|nr:alpha/beta hydrolase [Gaiellaceae bacterium]